jgi:quercetin dioxygenase-like cupin family protein
MCTAAYPLRPSELFRQTVSDFVQRLARGRHSAQHHEQYSNGGLSMAALEKGITENGTGYGGTTWNILGQVYFPKAVTDSTFAFETNSDPGQFVPVHIHPTQEEFILVQEGTLDLKLDGQWVRAHAGDLVRLPRGIPHGYFNKSDKRRERCSGCRRPRSWKLCSRNSIT